MIIAPAAIVPETRVQGPVERRAFEVTASLAGRIDFRSDSPLALSALDNGGIAGEVGANWWPHGDRSPLFLGLTSGAALLLGGTTVPQYRLNLTAHVGLGTGDPRWPRLGFQGYSLSLYGGAVVAPNATSSGSAALGWRAGISGHIPIGGVVFGRTGGVNSKSTSSTERSSGGCVTCGLSGLGNSGQAGAVIVAVASAIFVLLTHNEVEIGAETLYPPGAEPIRAMTFTLGYGI